MLNPATAGLILEILPYIPVVNPATGGIAFLGLEQNFSFMDGH
jgi:hypothetical protein